MTPERYETDVQNALTEVQQKSEADIERETAWKWSARAAACYRLFGRTGKAGWLEEATNFSHEAIEHAAMVCDGGEVLQLVEAAMAEERDRAKAQRR